MRKLLKIAAATGSTIVTMLLTTAKVAANNLDYDYGSDAASSALGSALCLGGSILPICGGIFGLVLGAFTIWMLIDVIQRDESVLPGKIKWLLVILLIPFGSVAYYFMRKKKLGAVSK